MSWNGVKKQSYEQEIKSWCEEMGIENYTINSKGEIDVDENVNLMGKDFKELPYKFSKVNGFFEISNNKNITSLKNCPNYIVDYFGCDNCSSLDSLDGCPRIVKMSFCIWNCKKIFIEEEIKLRCLVYGDIFINEPIYKS